MQVIEKFGNYIGEVSDTNPERARNLLKLGWQAQNLVFRFFPKKELMPADQYLAGMMMDTMLKPLKNPEESAIVSIFTPCELLQEVGLSPYNVEGFSCYLAATKVERACLFQTENSGISETLCSYHKTFIGAAEKGILPKPRCIVYTNLCCDANLVTFRKLSQIFQVPMFAIDVPMQQTEENVRYVADQLRELAVFLENCTGKKIEEERLKERLERSRRTLNEEKEIVTGIVLPTGAGAAIGAERALEEALKSANLKREDIDAVVTTGYGRSAIQAGDKSITEITCHARGAHFLDPEVRTVIDIGGQDSKVIRLDENGAVANFVMNDKCAAGTGRFLEMMARTMELNLDQMSETGLTYKDDITISSMCTVFAESEVVSLIAQNKATDDIVHGLNKAVASKTVALAKRVGGEEKYMMTGGVSKNKGLVKTLEEKLGTKLVISDKAQLCGALGAALFAADMTDGE